MHIDVYSIKLVMCISLAEVFFLAWNLDAFHEIFREYVRMLFHLVSIPPPVSSYLISKHIARLGVDVECR